MLWIAPAQGPLLDALAERVRHAQSKPGRWAFEAVEVLVPSREVEALVGEGLAERLGLAANLRFSRVREFLGRQVAAPDRALGRGEWVGALLEVLGEVERDPNPPADLVTLQTYLADAPVAQRGRRRVQLAWRLASCFHRYALWDPELLAAWREDRAPLDLGADPQAAQWEAWERALWRRAWAGVLRETQSCPSETGSETGPETGGGAWVAPDALPARVAAGDSEGAGELQLFGLGSLPPSRIEALVALARTRPVSIFAFGAPGAPWDAAGEAARQRWGEAAEGAGVPLRVEVLPTQDLPRENLGALQTWLRSGVGDGGGGGGGGGAGEEAVRRVSRAGSSLRILGAPGRWREAEAVLDEVWTWLRSAPAGASLDDVVIVTAGPSAEATRGLLEAAARGAGGPPLRVARPAVRPRLWEAVQLLFGLPESRLGREDLLRLLVHPCLGRSGELTREDCAGWAEAANLRWGADAQDWPHLEAPLYHWDQALVRLGLGSVLDPGPGGRVASVEVSGSRIYPLDPGEGKREAAAELIRLARGLIADARFARQASLTLAEWARFLQAWIHAALQAETDDDERALRQVGRGLRRLAQVAELSPRACSFGEARALAERLIGVPATRPRGQGLRVIAPGDPLPSAPRLVLVLGLGEGSFPRPEAPAPWDLSPLLGNLPSGRSRDAQALLEACLAARERLALSWVTLDLETGDLLPPSALLRQAMSALGLAPVRVPRRRFHETPGVARPPASPAAWREAALARARDALSQRLAGSPWPGIGELRQALDPALRRSIGLADELPAAPPLPAGTLRVSLSALHAFLLSPLQAWARTALRLPEEEEGRDPLVTRDEPFAADRRSLGGLLQRALFAILATPESPDQEARLAAAYDLEAERALHEGLLPAGVYGRAERNRHLGTLRAWAEKLEGLRDEFPLAEVHRFGAAVAEGPLDAVHAPLVVEARVRGEVRRIAISGATRPLLPASGRSLEFAYGLGRERHFLRLFLDRALLAALELTPAATPWRAVVVPSPWSKPLLERRYAALEPAAARIWLAERAAELLGAPHAYLLSGDLALACLRGKRSHEEGLAGLLREARDQGRSIRDRWGVVTRWRDLEPPAQAEALARRRWRAYVEARLPEGGES